MALAPTSKVVLGSIAFAIFWVLAVFPAVPFLPIGRTAGSLLGAMLMVVFQVLSADQAYAAIDLPILGLLFGTMVVTIFLERANMFKYLGKLLSWKSRGPKDLLCRICLISAISSAFFTNDTSCIVLTEFVLKIARQHNLPPYPFLLALATSANIGSSATPIGNPQNLVIAIQGKISFGRFLIGILPAMLVGVVVNVVMLIAMYWKVLSIQKDEEDPVSEVIVEEEVISHQFSPASMSHFASFNSQECNGNLEPSNNLQSSSQVHVMRDQSSPSVSEVQMVHSGTKDSTTNSSASKERTNDANEDTIPSKSVAIVVDKPIEAHVMHSSEGKDYMNIKWKRVLWKSCVYAITLVMLIAMLIGLNMAWTAIAAAITLVVLDFKDAGPNLDKVSYSLLIFFCGMFITVDGFKKTGIPSAMWDLMEPYSRIDHASGIAILAIVILVLSNLASNVPTVFPCVSFLPIGRTAGSLLGAMLMVIFKVLSPDQAFAAIDLPILGLLFGTMVVTVFLERADMFKYLGKLLSWKSRGPKDLLCRICLISAISSAFFTNDTSCVVLTEFVLKIARQHNLPPYPFLLALASSANIGSSATPIGNPQNLVIAIQGKISFGSFLTGILPAMLVGVIVNVVILIAMYWRVLTIHKDEEDPVSEVVAEEEVISHHFSPATMSHCLSFNSQECNNNPEPTNNLQNPSHQVHVMRDQTTPSESEVQMAIKNPTTNSNASKEETHDTKEETNPSRIVAIVVDKPIEVHVVHSSEGKDYMSMKWKRILWKSCVYAITLVMLVAMLIGVNMAWAAIAAAIILVVLDFKDAGPSLEKVSYSLLIFFCGMFITVDGFKRTGIPSALWDLMEPYSRIDHASGIAILAIVILVLSNVASNVPTVLLLGARVAASAAAISKEDEKKAWLILAWVSTIAGNFSLLGSAANLVVCEQARRAPNLGYTLTFWTHLKFGLPSTLIVTAIGLTLIK
ncbi:Silicon efflux transporter LSI2, partial [Mucuna pruriens]